MILKHVEAMLIVNSLGTVTDLTNRIVTPDPNLAAFCQGQCVAETRRQLRDIPDTFHLDWSFLIMVDRLDIITEEESVFCYIYGN